MAVHPRLSRSKSLFPPEVENPFIYELELPWYRKIQMAVATVTIIPVRLVVMAVSIMLAWAFACIILAGLKKDDFAKRPLSGWRKRAIRLCNFVGRLLWFAGSYLRIKIKGSPASVEETPIWVLAPHSSFKDVVILPLFSFPSIVGKEAVGDIPIFGSRSFVSACFTRKLRYVVQVLLKITTLAFGFVWRIRGQQASRDIATALLCAPHSSYVDSLALLLMDDVPYAVSRSSTADIPIIGKLALLCQPIFVYREDKNSRQNTIDEMKRRAHSNGEWQQLVIFPEGTTTNRKALISFKPGAFIPGMPVQPVVLRYPDEWDVTTWTWKGPGAALLLWMSLSKLWSTMEIEFLPVYIPNEAEKQDPHLYAENVRQVMAKALGVPVTDHTFEDCRLMEYAKKANLKMADGLVEFRKIQKRLGLRYDDVHKLLDKFCVLSNLNDNEGRVTLETFSKYMGLPINDSLTQLFNLYDRDGSGHIDFREYVIGMSLISEPAKDDATVSYAFRMFDKDDKGYVTKEEFRELLCDTLNASDEEADTLFNNVDTRSIGQVTYDDFKAYAIKMPEYASLFKTYHQLKEANTDIIAADIIDSNHEQYSQDSDDSQVDSTDSKVKSD